MTTSISDIKRVFIDTSAWIDLMNRNERHHNDAVTFHKSLAPMTLRITSWESCPRHLPGFAITLAIAKLQDDLL